jgi:hypothetical protein
MLGEFCEVDTRMDVAGGLALLFQCVLVGGVAYGCEFVYVGEFVCDCWLMLAEVRLAELFITGDDWFVTAAGGFVGVISGERGAPLGGVLLLPQWNIRIDMARRLLSGFEVGNAADGPFATMVIISPESSALTL